MKKKGSVVLIVLVAIIVGAVLYNTGLLDTRFWFYNRDEWKPFHNGNYVCGVDIEPGSYDVHIRGKSEHAGICTFKSIITDEYTRDTVWVQQGDNGFHFTIGEGEYMNASVPAGREMKYKKVD